MYGQLCYNGARSRDMKVSVSDHAIVRYLERVKGMDIKAIRKEILPKHMSKAVSQLGNGFYPVGDTHRVRVKGGVVVTVLTKDMKAKRVRSKMQTRNKAIIKSDKIKRKRLVQ